MFLCAKVINKQFTVLGNIHILKVVVFFFGLFCYFTNIDKQSLRYNDANINTLRTAYVKLSLVYISCCIIVNVKASNIILFFEME